MNLNDKLKVNTKVFCRHPRRGFGKVLQILNEGEPYFNSPTSFTGYYCFEAVFNHARNSRGISVTGVYYLTAKQVLDNVRANRDADDPLWLVDYTWQYPNKKHRKPLNYN